MTEIARMLQTLQHIQANLAAVEASLARIEELLNRLVRGSFGDNTEYANWNEQPRKNLP